ncbi:MAG TPA: hypothetical protein VF616_30940 [Duganella sp.]|uniref:hypothetical protein n=1 Tax=Duganella sp. TaxID=1904440 RepID=UPI002ED39BFA
MTLSFRGLSIVTALLFALIGSMWLLAPQLPLSDWGLALTPSAALLGRRSAALYAGVALMFFLARNAEPSTARTALSNGMVAIGLMLAALGVFDFATGHVTPHILVPVVLEVGIALAFLSVGRAQPLRARSGRK